MSTSDTNKENQQDKDAVQESSTYEGMSRSDISRMRKQASVYSTRKKWKKRSIFSAISVVVLIIVLIGGAFGYALYRYHQIHRVNVVGLKGASSDKPQNILMVGNNSRCALNGQQSGSFGSCSQVGGARSDVIMILHLNPANNTVSLLSIPRDLLAPIPGLANPLKIDSSLNYGPGRLVKTIESDFGITINHYVELNFDSFQGVVNALGGINLYFPEPVYDSYSGLNPNHLLETGCLHLDGFQALAEVRSRHMWYYQNGRWHYDGEGDLSRIRRDHEFLKVLASQLQQRGLGNPLTVKSLLGAVVPQLTVDSGFGLSTMVGLVSRYHTVNPNTMFQATLPVFINPVGYYYKGIPYADVVFPSEPFDQNAIDGWLGLSSPPSANLSPIGITVEVVNASGQYGYGTSAIQQLSSAGFSVTNGGTATPVGSPAETTVVYNGPSALADAQRVADNLSGAVMLQNGPTPNGVDVVINLSANAVVNTFTSGGPQSAGFTPATSATSVSPTSNGNQSTSSTRGIPGRQGVTSTLAPPRSTQATSTTLPQTTTTTSPIGPATNSQNPLMPWDPRACPPGSRVVNANFNG